MSPSAKWQPTCSMEMLRLRADMLAAARRFFADHCYMEVETPLLSRDVVVDAHLEPFAVNDDSHEPLFLQTSPEAGMKRLLAAGSGSIFQITRSFRQREQGTRHNPEFTIIEWYGVNTTYRDQMQVTRDLVRAMVEQCKTLESIEWWAADFLQTRYEQAFERSIGCSVLDLSATELAEKAIELKFMESQSEAIERDDLLNLILAECVEPHLGQRQPEFIYDYPLSQAALATQCSDDPRTACRFELYARGLELCNGYQELTDVDELRRRDLKQNEIRQTHGSEGLPGAPRMTSAMAAGLPSCSGVALGFDRLVMAVTVAASISDVMPFPMERA